MWDLKGLKIKLNQFNVMKYDNKKLIFHHEFIYFVNQKSFSLEKQKKLNSILIYIH